MQKFRILFVITLLYLSACDDEKQTDQTLAIKDTSTTQKIFFPVTDFIRGRLVELDSVPNAPLKIITENGKSDSSWVKRKDIRAFTKPFLTGVFL